MAQGIVSPFERERLAAECRARLSLLTDGQLNEFAEFLYAWLANASRHASVYCEQRIDELFDRAGEAGGIIAEA